jgi:hypothetical protein
MNESNHAPAGIDLDSINRYDLSDSIGVPGLISSPNGELVYLADVESLLARRTAPDAPAADEHEAFEAWFAREFPLQNGVDMRFKRDGDQYFSCFMQDRWDGWKARAAHPIGQVSPAIDQADDALHALIVNVLSQHRMVRMFEVEDDGALGNSYPLIDRLSLDDGQDVASGKEEIDAIAWAIVDAMPAQSPAPVCHAPADATGKADAASAGGLTGEMMDALIEAHDTAMLMTVQARVPECGDFGGIAQNLAYVLERLKTDSPATSAAAAEDAQRLDYIEKHAVRGATYNGITSINIVVHSDDWVAGGVRWAIDCMSERSAMAASRNGDAGGQS